MIKISERAARKIRDLRRYRVTLTHGDDGFAVTVSHGLIGRKNRVLKVSRSAQAAVGNRTVAVGLRNLDEFTVHVVEESLATKVETLARAQLGIKESPADSNNVKFNTWFYGRAVNGLAFSWCAVFVSWVLTHCGRPFHFAYVPFVVNTAKLKQQGLSVIPFSDVSSTLAAGFPVLACYDWPGESPGLADHIGFVVDVVDSTNFHAIEGNTSPSSAGSQSNGGMVALKLRPRSDVQAFVKVGPAPKAS